MRWILQGPFPFVVKHIGYHMNGLHFVTCNRDSTHITQDSKVTLVAEATHVDNTKDKNLITCDVTFYGVLDEIWIVTTIC